MNGASRNYLDNLLTSETRPADVRPDPCAYDPMAVTHWTPLEAIIWIATRDANQVREAAPSFRKDWLTWRRVVQDHPYDENGNYTPFLPSTRKARTRLVWRQRPIGPSRFREESLRCADIAPSRDELWAILSTGRLTASGLRGRIQFNGADYSLDDEALRPIEAERQEIGAHEWADLHIPGDAPRPLSEGPMNLTESLVAGAVQLFDRTQDGPDVVRSARGAVYFDVRLPAAKILEQWERRSSLDDLLLAEANRNGGKITQREAERIARANGFLESRDVIISRINALNINDKQGRKSAAK